MATSVLSNLRTLLNKKQQPRLILGLMSGTSLDGLDIALCEIKGHGLGTSLHLKFFESVGYGDNYLEQIRPLFANPDAKLIDICKANAFIAREHANIVLETLHKWQFAPEEIDLIASHGQTVFHAPESIALSTSQSKLSNSPSKKTSMASSTLQIGDGDHLAYLTGIVTMSDFRQKHIAAGGEGAPLVPYADYLLYSDKQEHRVLINIGGIANYTYLPANTNYNEIKSADTGPGNTLMDAVIQYALENGLAADYPQQKPYDESGELALSGVVNQQLLDILLSYSDSYQDAKSTGQEVYNLSFVELALTELSGIEQQESLLPTDIKGLANLVATLNLFTARLISNALLRINIHKQSTIYISGGGIHNKALLDNIQDCLSEYKVQTVDTLDMPSDAKEAALFAVLANESLYGDYDIFQNDKGLPATSLGKLSFP